ncbi:MAG: hypothetical protein M3362_14285, partial [Acidobacteriota bacterium]|nr:hypothetical protein [Acidobacteriota bacterium]
MKRCPKCNRTFEDTLTYCLIDGSILSAPFDPQAAFIIPQQNLAAPMVHPARKSNRTLWIVLACSLLLAALAAGVIALVNRNSNSSESSSNVAQQDKPKTNEAGTNNRNDNSRTATAEKTPENKSSENTDSQPTTGRPAEDL